MLSPETILKSTFGYDSFRPLQREIIGNVLARHDSLAIMPTGGGKSLCYQIPALLFDGLTVVVSPLIALMKDQVEQLRAAGVPALFLNSTLSPEAYSENMDCVRRGQTKLLYLAPETLLVPRILALLAEVKVDCLTLTATATPRVRADIIRSLGLQGSNEFVASFNRENRVPRTLQGAVRHHLLFLAPPSG